MKVHARLIYTVYLIKNNPISNIGIFLTNENNLIELVILGRRRMHYLCDVSQK